MTRAERMDTPTPPLFVPIALPVDGPALLLAREQLSRIIEALNGFDTQANRLFFSWPAEAQLALPHRLTVETRLTIRAAADKAKALLDWLEMAEPK